ncbi:TetR family transcriptional regulator [Hyphomonas jannaschiana VP2]|jgi:AcrR family transcriptional regulator|uniref:TetR family transcriptional regulator n=2 Tax=Hyphomonas jannaschiana TaxID=86 RepID=A0A059FH06_9PROT|nr:TetR family transcriptional regulator [Hyphomonas jannaschiana VP2]
MSPQKRPPSRKTVEKRKQVSTTAKQQPQQTRSQDTYELILETTGNLLDEVGLERLSTNLVCRRAGLTPPALYRYFPNKYAILRELGDRLMALQDEAVLSWIDEGGLETEDFDAAVASNVRLQERVNEITRQFPGNIFVLRALRAIPLLREVRIASRDMVAERMADAMVAAGHTASRERLLEAACLTTELTYSGMEMILEEPSRDGRQICVDLARMMVTYYSQLDS